MKPPPLLNLNGVEEKADIIQYQGKEYFVYVNGTSQKSIHFEIQENGMTYYASVLMTGSEIEVEDALETVTAIPWGEII